MSALATPAPPTVAATPGKPTRSSEAGRAQSRGGRRALGVLAVVLSVLWVFPIYWMINSAFLPLNRLQTPTPTFFPVEGTLSNFRRVIDDPSFWTSMRVSLAVVAIVLVAALVFAFLAALAVSRFRFRTRAGFIITILIVQMIPAEAMIIATFRLIDGWNLLNSIIGLSAVYVATVLPFTIWTLRGFVNGVPAELEEAAMIDGLSRAQAFWRITFPLLAPGLVATGVFGFIQAWNEFMFALVLNPRPEAMTLPVWLRTFLDPNGGVVWAEVMAGSTLVAIPVIIFFLIVQGRMTSGLVAGAVKG